MLPIIGCCLIISYSAFACCLALRLGGNPSTTSSVVEQKGSDTEVQASPKGHKVDDTLCEEITH